MTAVLAPESTATTASSVVTSSRARIALALARLATGFIFLWAFLDKTFGLHYSTGAAVAEGEPSLSWIDGGTPSQGFLKFGTTGPLKDFFGDIASPATDWLFMLGMLGVGLAVMLGIGLRVSAVAGSLIMALMWLAEWPLQQGSTNPLIDYHVIYALVLIIAALTFAGDTWGLGKWWANLPIVQKYTWLR
ncbi:DoxX family protein [Cellulomonas edaphi]|uniref:DoxX family protein n=1 Tax=Cellulomonas edaphi TaxID=3053468 RepID=A0ABT7S9U8_9CELL|nr:DoxX family protein [Cellulomons edaphi]MDM7832403.1 DoxX family protein [Cellulomons edaphi]